MSGFDNGRASLRHEVENGLKERGELKDIEKDLMLIKKNLGNDYLSYYVRRISSNFYIDSDFSILGFYSSILDDQKFLMDVEISGKEMPLRNCIYYILIDQYIKIGYTNDLRKRLKQYKTHTPTIRILGLEKGSILKEKEIHAKFNNYRINNEFFTFNYELLKYISNIDYGENVFFYFPTKRKDLFGVSINNNGQWVNEKSEIIDRPMEELNPDTTSGSIQVSRS